MLQVKNIQYYPNLAWDAYCRLPAVSFSSLKGGSVPTTQGMHIGKLVHTYILKPAEYDYEESDVVIPIATELIKFVGHTLLRNSICEVPITADFVYDGFTLPWRGIPDIRIPNILTIDLKVLDGSLQNYIDRFDYDHQVEGYCLGGSTPNGLIIAYNKKRKKVEKQAIPLNTRFWEHITLTRGTPCLQTNK